MTNKAGPVRAIRSYIGANSGPLTQREHIFYEQREDVRTFLRVHAVPGPWDFLDFSSAAIGMTYRNNLRTRTASGSTAVPDAVTNGRSTWESIDGPQGGLSQSHTLVTDIPALNGHSFYLDDKTPSGGQQTQCTGDAEAIGQSGPWLNSDAAEHRPAHSGLQLARPRRGRSTSRRPARPTARRAPPRPAASST